MTFYCFITLIMFLSIHAAVSYLHQRNASHVFFSLPLLLLAGANMNRLVFLRETICILEFQIISIKLNIL